MFTLPKCSQAITSAAHKANYVSSRFSWIKLRGEKKIDFALSEKLVLFSQAGI